MSTNNPITSYNFELASAASTGTIGLEVVYARDPATTDLSGPSGPYSVGQLWFSKATSRLFVLASNSQGIAAWQVMQASGAGVSTITGNSGSPLSGAINVVGTGPISTSGSGSTLTISSSGVSTLAGNTGGAISPTAGNINIQGSGSVAVAGAGNTLTISLTSSSTFVWVNNATSQATLSNHGYIITTGAQSFTLPASPAVGDNIKFILNGGTSWTITLSNGQTIKDIASTGPVTYSTSVASGNSDATALSIVCTTTGAGSTWSAESGIGIVTGT